MAGLTGSLDSASPTTAGVRLQDTIGRRRFVDFPQLTDLDGGMLDNVFQQREAAQLQSLFRDPAGELHAGLQECSPCVFSPR